MAGLRWRRVFLLMVDSLLRQQRVSEVAIEVEQHTTIAAAAAMHSGNHTKFLVVHPTVALRFLLSFALRMSRLQK